MSLDNFYQPEFIISTITAIGILVLVVFAIIEYKSKHQKVKVEKDITGRAKKSDIIRSMVKEKEEELNKERKLYKRIEIEKELSKLESKLAKAVKKESKK